MAKKELDIMSNNFGIEIKKKLLDIKMPQNELAKKLNVTEAYISLILSDKKEALDMRRQILSLVKEAESRCVVNE